MSLQPKTEETIHEGPRFTVKRGTFGEGSEQREREWIESPAAVAVVAYSDKDVYLVRQPREAIGRDDILEIPAGLMDVDGETPLQTAMRELEEEVGLVADDWVQGPSYFSTAGMTDEVTHIFLATGLTRVAGAEDGIEVVTWPRRDLDGLIDGSNDAKTLVGLLWLRRAELLGGTAGTTPA
jgi:8-oxo-dGTP pyrophosphatase MutT (NUDIX family)